MVQTKVRAIDADGHVLEDLPKMWEYLEEPYRTFREHMDVLAPTDGWERNLGQKLYRGPASKAEDWLDALERGDMESTVLYPTIGLNTSFIQDPDYRVVFVRAYNNWLANEICRHGGGRIRGMAILPTYSPEEAAKELRRAKTELGLVGGMFAADGAQLLLGHRGYDIVYTAAAELDVPIAIHGTGSHLGGGGVEMFPKFIQAHSVTHPFGILRQFTSLMFEGVFEKFPTVRFAFLEAGATWVPWYLDRMDEEYEHRGEMEAPLLKKKPNEYVHQGGNIFFGCESDERLLAHTMDLIGDDVLMYASDYPHWDGTYPNSLRELEAREDLTESQRYGVLRGAAERFYGLT